MSYPGITLASLRRQLNALKRKYARLLAVAHLKPVTDQITELWNIAVAKERELYRILPSPNEKGAAT